MDSNFNSKGCLPSHESVLEEVIMLKKELCNHSIKFITNIVGSIQGQTGFQFYMKFNLSLNDLHVSLRPKESSWPIVFLEFFMPDSID